MSTRRVRLEAGGEATLPSGSRRRRALWGAVALTALFGSRPAASEPWTEPAGGQQRIAPRYPVDVRVVALDVLDRLHYRSLAIGFPLMTLGIITGAVWANSAWGRYWGWDPKETWSLITWFIYATLLHAKLMRGWHGKRIAYLSIAGFAAVLGRAHGAPFGMRAAGGQSLGAGKGCFGSPRHQR